jgi:hypothetical protein
MSETLSAKLRKLATVKKSEKRAKAEHDALTEERIKLEKECFDIMWEEDGKDSSRKLDGVGFRPVQTPYASIQDEDEFIAWALENDRSLIATMAREGLLNQLVRTALHNKEELPPGIGYYNREKISMTGLKASMEQEEDEDE